MATPAQKKSVAALVMASMVSAVWRSRSRTMTAMTVRSVRSEKGEVGGRGGSLRWCLGQPRIPVTAVDGAEPATGKRRAHYTTGRWVLKPAQRALARQWRAPFPACLELARLQRQRRVAPQVVVVVEVIVSQGNAGDALRHQRPHRMFRKTGIAVVREARGNPVEESGGTVRLAKQQCPGVRRDRSAVERGGHPAALAPCGLGTLEIQTKAAYTCVSIGPPWGVMSSSCAT